MVNDLVYFWLFIASVTFIVLPLFCNVFQLSKEIETWKKESNDEIFGSSEVYSWVRGRIKLIYIISFICGSSFSAVALLNSYLFKLELFSMGLSRKQRFVFENKRIFSIVFLEVCYIKQILTQKQNKTKKNT